MLHALTDAKEDEDFVEESEELLISCDTSFLSEGMLADEGEDEDELLDMIVNVEIKRIELVKMEKN